MSQLLLVIQIISGVVVTILVLMQSQGSGLGSTFGSSFNFYGTKRGAERVLFIGTIVISILFLATSFLSVVIH